ncbi:MAG TPA: pimeloyl-[acyl-carrier protein] methyl ester esterase [Sedimenticola thiotaurini]|uniref:Pimeloyl-[acyl-carrier protein] methyl ester esterase n=1 Tax=Sedimenticola thiotaurini TaxID=1543721 RepID=A0A831W8Z6_9GAMM|nr:pimeloyl-[acyl-carrier protein] methyl ester esterase [Sedimenticola thiotaurini]
MNSAVWAPLLEDLAPRFRITLLELPGHGDSGYDSSRPDLEAWTAACLAAAPARAHWLGWSLGGQIAQLAALQRPGRVDRLVLLASTPRFVQGDGWPHAMSENTLRQFAATLRRNHRQTLARFLALQVQGDESARETLRLLRRELAARPEPDDLALEHGLELLLTTDLRPRLAQLRRPSLWLLGQRDTLTPAAVAPELEALAIPHSRIRVIDGGAHALFLSHPAATLAQLVPFLEGRDE